MSRCPFCHEEVKRDDRVYWEVLGWERPGKGASGQSGSSLVLRKRTGVVAHALCIERAKMGLHPGQQTLA